MCQVSADNSTAVSGKAGDSMSGTFFQCTRGSSSSPPLTVQLFLFSIRHPLLLSGICGCEDLGAKLSSDRRINMQSRRLVLLFLLFFFFKLHATRSRAVRLQTPGVNLGHLVSYCVRENAKLLTVSAQRLWTTRRHAWIMQVYKVLGCCWKFLYRIQASAGKVQQHLGHKKK